MKKKGNKLSIILILIMSALLAACETPSAPDISEDTNSVVQEVSEPTKPTLTSNKKIYYHSITRKPMFYVVSSTKDYIFNYKGNINKIIAEARFKILEDDSLVDSDVLYYGDINDNGLPHGKGELYRVVNETPKLIYEGDFKEGAIDGEGKSYDAITGEIQYQGSYISNQEHGKGISYWKGDDGVEYVYEGDFHNNLKHGNGDFYINGNLVYSGEITNDLVTGYGKIYYRSDLYQRGNLAYEGYVVDSYPNGSGILYYNISGEVPQFIGEFKNGKPHGYVEVYDEQGNFLGAGIFENGEYVGQ